MSSTQGAFTSEPDPELPAYIRNDSGIRRERTEHVVELRNGHDKAWAVLKMLSHAPFSSSVPVFLEVDGIRGSLDLHLEKEDPIQQVTITVAGRTTSGEAQSDFFNFWQHSQVLWSAPSKSKGGLWSGILGDNQNGKLIGDHSFLFSISIPKGVVFPESDGGEMTSYRLPETFMERRTRGSVFYSITVDICDRSFARIAGNPVITDIQNVTHMHHRLFSKFAYIPVAQPGPPSELRQAAYQENAPVLGPAEDPEGWQTFPAVLVRGKIFSARDVELTCSLSIAKPLCYTRGTAIPCHLRVESDDAQALDLLSIPTAIVLKLRRTVEYGSPTVKVKKGLEGHRKNVTDCHSAYWFPATKDLAQIRELAGEIRLGNHLKLSGLIPHFCVAYSVVLYPLEATGFQPTNRESLLEETVEIVAGYAPGPRTKIYSPPDYDTSPKPYNDRQYMEDESAVGPTLTSAFF